jgi:nitrite reductase/ring-hydroxylating ferredoxin subunit
MADYIVARVDDFPAGTRKMVQAGRVEVGVFNIEGRYYALPNTCVHQFGPVCEGRISGTLMADEGTHWQPAWVQEGEILICPWHALEYDVATGRCLAYPKVRLRQYPVRVDGEHVVVSL